MRCLQSSSASRSAAERGGGLISAVRGAQRGRRKLPSLHGDYAGNLDLRGCSWEPSGDGGGEKCKIGGRSLALALPC